MVEIKFDDEFPEMLREQTKLLLDEVVWLLPLWLQKLRVGWDANDPDHDAAWFRINPDYRFARVTICSGFLNEDKRTQFESLYHEMFHAFNAPIADIAHEILDVFCPESENEKLHAVWKGKIRSVLESRTQDFAYVIAKKFNA